MFEIHAAIEKFAIHHMKECSIQLLQSAELFQIELLTQRINVVAAQMFLLVVKSNTLLRSTG